MTPTINPAILSGMSDTELAKIGYKRIKKGGKNPSTVIEQVGKKIQLTIETKKDILSPEDLIVGLIYPKKGSRAMNFLIADFLKQILAPYISKIDTKLLMTAELDAILVELENYDYGNISRYLLQVPTKGGEMISMQNSMLATQHISLDDKAKFLSETVFEMRQSIQQFLSTQK